MKFIVANLLLLMPAFVTAQPAERYEVIIDEIMADSLQSYVRGIRRNCDQVHTALYQTYISYLTETVLS